MNILLIVLFGIGIIVIGFIMIKLARKRKYAYLPAIAFLGFAFLFLALAQFSQQSSGFADLIYALFGVFMIIASILSALIALAVKSYLKHKNG